MQVFFEKKGYSRIQKGRQKILSRSWSWHTYMFLISFTDEILQIFNVLVSFEMVING